MRIAFAAIYDLDDINRGSGTYHYIYNEIKKQKIEIFKIGPIDIKFPIISKIFRFFAKRILKKRYRSYQDPFVGRQIGKIVRAQLSKEKYDILVTNDFAIAGYTKIQKPTILWTDAVFPYDYKTNNHPWLKNLPWFAVKFCQAVTRAGLKRAITFVPAHWNAKELTKYGLNSSNQIKVIPFGANLNDPGKEVSQFRINRIKDKNNIDILFVGKDKKLKRLDMAVEIVTLLNEKNYNAHLHVVGIENHSNSQYIDYYGILNKEIKDQRNEIFKLYTLCDIFLLPSIAEGYGIAYMEASAFGMPQIGCKTQGVTTSVKDGISGKLFNVDDTPISYVKTIISWKKDMYYYDYLVSGARKHFEENGKWENIIKRFIYEVRQII